MLETGEFERVGSSRTIRADVRILSATNADLGAEVAAGRFRQDLLFRLNTIEIRVPALRERREDIPLLAQHFLEAHARRYRKAIAGFDAAASTPCSPIRGPATCASSTTPSSAPSSCGRRPDPARGPRRCAAAATAARLEELTLEEVEGLLVRKAMERFGGNVSQAAQALGLSRSALYRRLEKHGQ